MVIGNRVEHPGVVEFRSLEHERISFAGGAGGQLLRFAAVSVIPEYLRRRIRPDVRWREAYADKLMRSRRPSGADTHTAGRPGVWGCRRQADRVPKHLSGFRERAVQDERNRIGKPLAWHGQSRTQAAGKKTCRPDTVDHGGHRSTGIGPRTRHPRNVARVDQLGAMLRRCPFGSISKVVPKRRRGIDQFILAGLGLERSGIPIDVTQPQLALTVGPIESRVALTEVAGRTVGARRVPSRTRCPRTRWWTPELP